MRRTMHAAAILLACATQIQAQSPSDRQVNVDSRSTLVRSENATGSAEMFADSSVLTPSHYSAKPVTFQGDAGRPYSQLAAIMQCNDWRPNVWDGYPYERAAIVARISQHVDMQCKCFECQTKLHASPCDQGCGGGSGCKDGGCKAGGVKKVRNRYHGPVSTLFALPSDACSAKCGTTCGNQTSCSSPSSSNTCGPTAAHSTSIEGSQPVSPVSSVRVVPTMNANPPQDRMATPVINNPMSRD